MAQDSQGFDLGKVFQLPQVQGDVETENKVVVPDRTIYNLGIMLFAVIVAAILVNGIVRNATSG
jgi:hypothetical protein